MKKVNLKIVVFALMSLFLVVSCEKDDVDELRKLQKDQKAELAAQKAELAKLAARLQMMENLTTNVNSDIQNIQKLVDGLQRKVSVVSYEALEDGSGYALKMSDNTTLTLKNGADGKNGENGKDGKDGKDGENGKDGKTPIVNIKADADGSFYWTLNGEWILDAEGNKIRAIGKDGRDGQDGANGEDGRDAIAPSLRINTANHWEVSKDGGITWQEMKDTLGNPIAATGKDGKDGKDGKNGKDGRNGRDGADGADGDANLTITEDAQFITIVYQGVTYKIPKGNIPPTIETVLVAGGTFQMGSPNGVGENNERPQHSVTLSDFYISKHEITNAQYAEFLNAQGNQTEGGTTWLDITDADCQIEEVGGVFKAKAGKENYPVIKVTWYGAKAYAVWAGGRLPTEAEWEYAARGGNQSNGYKYSGSNTLADVAWYNGNSGAATHPVGTKQANELGIYDMSGNVYEWCEDKWHGDYTGAPTDGSAWVSGTSDFRVLRGGSWDGNANSCRVANRFINTPYLGALSVGFRVVFP